MYQNMNHTMLSQIVCDMFLTHHCLTKVAKSKVDMDCSDLGSGLKRKCYQIWQKVAKVAKKCYQMWQKVAKGVQSGSKRFQGLPWASKGF